MKIKNSLTLLSLMLFLSFFLTKQVFCGIIMEKLHTYQTAPGSFKKEKIISYFQDNMVKTIQEDGSYVIVDLNKGKFIYINPQEKEYSENTIDELVKQTQKGVKELKSQFEGLPPEQRAMIEKMMGLSNKPKIKASLKATGKKETIAGFPAEKYIISRGNKVVGEYWVSKEVRKLITQELDAAKIEEFEKAMNNLSKQMDFLGDGSQDEIMKLEDELHKKGEIVKEIKIINYMNMATKDQEELISIKKQDLPSSFFAIPKNFKKIEVFKDAMGISK